MILALFVCFLAKVPAEAADPSNAPDNAEAATEGSNPLAVFEPYIGQWRLPADSPFLEDHPEFASHVSIEWAWGPRRRAVRNVEGFPPGDREAAIVEGTISWDPAAGRIVFLQSQTRDGLLFRGEYTAGAGELNRTYEVHYAPDQSRPAPEYPGNVRRFREIFRPDGADALNVQLDIYDFAAGGWKPWGRYGGTYRLMRIAGDNPGNAAFTEGLAPLPEEARRRLEQLLGRWSVETEFYDAAGQVARTTHWENHGEWLIPDRLILLTHDAPELQTLSKTFVFYDPVEQLFRMLDVNQKGDTWSLSGKLDSPVIVSEPRKTTAGTMIVRFTHEDIDAQTLRAIMHYSLDDGETWVKSQRQTLRRK
ncbi:hypothetical protein ABI59_15230 [Acidobacteria bacterium Mor1]|nr:hypothetical protein ABI59_15230 [Acidobacteria bacterium Mor1]